MEEFGSISFSFPAGFSETDRRALLETPMVVRWLRKMEREFRLSRVEFVSVDWMRREPHRALFAKLRADARDLSGRPTNGIVLLRGDAVGILVVLRVEGEAEPRLLLTRQARVPAAEPSLAEIPAGMMDGSESPREVAVREMKEETGLDVSEEELVDLLPAHPDGYLSSVGLMDERLYLFAYEKTVTADELRKICSGEFGLAEENEHIVLEAVPASRGAELQDGKSLTAWALWNLGRNAHQEGETR
ncbi:MAG: NUDIX domain-containing protein [Fibrobacterales bacterium]|nr:NUDIX domain-containing protein [Fibrobacterales bacterium]